MLWLGKWRVALGYFFAIAVVIALFLILPAFALTSPTISGLKFADYVFIVFALFGVLGFLHAMVVRRRALNRPWYSRWYVAVVAWPILVLGSLLIVRTIGFQTFNVTADSMAPNLINGDHFLVSKSAYGYSRFSFPFAVISFDGRTGSSFPRRGDIAVFKLPADTNTDYVKRVIGLPGDHIQILDGTLILNGEAVSRQRLGTENEYMETLPGGRSYRILDLIDGSAGDNTDEYIVPTGHYFVMGDNRDNSEDSRFLSPVGYVPVENFLGPVVYVYWNGNGVPINGRPW
jgi:signal peptidase I